VDHLVKTESKNVPAVKVQHAFNRHRLSHGLVSRYAVGAFAIAITSALSLACNAEDPRTQEIVDHVRSSTIEHTDTTWGERLSLLCGSVRPAWGASSTRRGEWRINVSCPGVLSLTLLYDESLGTVSLLDR
jgi:hypothetical protein